MKKFSKVGIVGTGLIGGSLGLAIKAKGISSYIVGTSRKIQNINWAKKIKAIDEGSLKPEIFADVDLLIFATPIDIILSLAPKLAKLVKKDCLVIDVGSTKTDIVKTLSKIFPNFVGCHPLAGSEKKGIKYAGRDLFKDSICIITRHKGQNQQALTKVMLLWSKLGARVISMEANQHDKIVSYVSHLPHAVAFALMNSIPEEDLKFGASGLKDTTRIAASDSKLWADIFFTNKENLIKAIDVFEINLSKLKCALSLGDKKNLLSFFEKAKQKRQRLE